MNPTHRRKPPIRTTVPIPTNIRPEMIERAKGDGERAGYRSLRAYLEALIAQGLVPDEIDLTEEPVEPDEETRTVAALYPSSSWALGPAILANRMVLVIEALTERIRAGENMEPLRTDLMSLRFEIVQSLLGLRKDYDREVEVRDQRHYGRLGGVE